MIILFVFCSPQQNSIKIIDCLNWMSGYFCLNNPIHKQLRLTTTLAFWSSYTDMDHANLWVTKSLSGKRKKEPWDNWLLRVYFKRSQKERLRFRALPFFIVFAIDPDKQNKKKAQQTHKKGNDKNPWDWRDGAVSVTNYNPDSLFCIPTLLSDQKKNKIHHWTMEKWLNYLIT